jgi:hypothetical protein
MRTPKIQVHSYRINKQAINLVFFDPGFTNAGGPALNSKSWMTACVMENHNSSP